MDQRRSCPYCSAEMDRDGVIQRRRSHEVVDYTCPHCKTRIAVRVMRLDSESADADGPDAPGDRGGVAGHEQIEPAGLDGRGAGVEDSTVPVPLHPEPHPVPGGRAGDGPDAGDRPGSGEAAGSDVGGGGSQPARFWPYLGPPSPLPYRYMPDPDPWGNYPTIERPLPVRVIPDSSVARYRPDEHASETTARTMEADPAAVAGVSDDRTATPSALGRLMRLAGPRELRRIFRYLEARRRQQAGEQKGSQHLTDYPGDDE